MNVYADNAATTRMSQTALDAVRDCMENTWGNPSSLYETGQKAKTALEQARERVAAALNALPGEILFTSGGSEADNQAIRGAAALGKAKGKTHIISTTIEHHAVLHTLKRLEREGFTVTLLPVDAEGLVTARQVAEAIRDDTCLVTVMYANNEIGTVEPIAEIGAVCRERGVLFHTDAVQAAGHLPVDVKADNVDLLSLSGHKFHGPKGVGALYVRRGVRIPPLIEGGSQERGKRAGTENLPGIVGMAAALSEAVERLPEETARLTGMRDALIAGLSEIPYGVLNGARTNRLPGSVSFCFEAIEGESIILLLDDLGISVSSGSACTSGSLDPSHVLLAIGRPHEIAHGSVRITLGAYNDASQVPYIVDSVKAVVERLRNMSPVWRDLNEGKRQHVIPA